jgi:hypothetical protein
MPVPQVLPLKGQHYISKMMGDSIFRYAIALSFDEAFGFDEVLSFDDLIVLMANPDILGNWFRGGDGLRPYRAHG